MWRLMVSLILCMLETWFLDCLIEPLRGPAGPLMDPLPWLLCNFSFGRNCSDDGIFDRCWLNLNEIAACNDDWFLYEIQTAIDFSTELKRRPILEMVEMKHRQIETGEELKWVKQNARVRMGEMEQAKRDACELERAAGMCNGWNGKRSNQNSWTGAGGPEHANWNTRTGADETTRHILCWLIHHVCNGLLLSQHLLDSNNCFGKS